MPDNDYLENRINILEEKINRILENQTQMKVDFQEINKVYANEKRLDKIEAKQESLQKTIYKWGGGLSVLIFVATLAIRYFV